MARKLKLTALILGATFAIGAIGASAASATDVFTTDGTNAVVTGTGTDNVFKITAGEATPGKTSKLNEFKCATAKFAGTINNGAGSVTNYPTYKGIPGGTHEQETGVPCNASIGTTTYDMNGCTYDLSGNTIAGDANIWVSCPGINKIQITGALGCTTSIPSQTPTGGGVSYTNGTNPETGKKDVTLTFTVTGLTYEATAACALVGIPNHGNNADYTGTVTVNGYEDTCAVIGGVNQCPTNGDEFDEGNATDIEYSES